MAAAVYGWYDLSWTGGSFEVSFRPGGHFFCPRFQAGAKWELEGDTIKIDWGKFGKYELKWNASAKSMDGMCVSVANPNPEKDWRKALFKKPLSAVETLLFGEGAGTEWDLQWEGGEFPIQFKCDGYNHFKCVQFPAHAHWALEDDVLSIFWGEFGNYVLKVDATAKTMAGSVKDKPEDWRKAKWHSDIYNSGSHEVCNEHH
eukprot:TRINITY_DN24759_c0_g1_i1.p1 TRINITY_DN24759_c0_g1~~TRINITY_DN24759_c0_g1_i1.p1  ORF type:complete len:227 (+),score=58.71 TRINITY_DN24759_c0_g1_i1:78-683(+)